MACDGRLADTWFGRRWRPTRGDCSTSLRRIRSAILIARPIPSARDAENRDDDSEKQRPRHFCLPTPVRACDGNARGGDDKPLSHTEPGGVTALRIGFARMLPAKIEYGSAAAGLIE
jgi:hypothetical protein